jgi:hypothetical protein
MDSSSDCNLSIGKVKSQGCLYDVERTPRKFLLETSLMLWVAFWTIAIRCVDMLSYYERETLSGPENDLAGALT